MPMVRFIILFFCLLVSSQCSFADDQPIPFVYSNQKLFAKFLVSEKDYHRAISEIYRIKFSYSDQFDPELELMLLESYYYSNLHDNVLKNSRKLLRNKQILSDPGFQNRLGTFYTASLVEKNDLSKASEVWNQHCQPFNGEYFLNGLSLPEPVDPDKARLYSALLPGSGLFASGEYGKGVVSFLLNAVFIAGAIHYVSEEQYGVAGLLVFFEIGWYFGGQNAAYEAAEDYNKKNISGAQKSWIAEKVNEINTTLFPAPDDHLMQVN